MDSESLFHLDSRLKSDTIHLASWPLCDLLLMNDSQYPWCILVPRIAGASELFHLSRAQRQQLDTESVFLSRTLMSQFHGDKLNVAALGNVVKQLHIHHVVRFESDLCWPAPIWGKYPVKAYPATALDERIQQLSALVKPDWLEVATAEQ